MWVIGSGPDRLHHAPATDRAVLEYLEDKPLDDETEPADDEEAPEHHVGVEVLLGVEDDPAEPPAGGRDHLAADDRDPGAGEGLAKPRDDERQRARQHHLPEHGAVAGAHRLGRPHPDAIHRLHAGPGVENDRNARRVAQAEPEDEERHPGERGDGAQHAHERQRERLGPPEATHEHTDGHADRHRQRQADDDPEHRVADVHEQRAVEHHPADGGADRENRRRDGRRQHAAAGEDLPRNGAETEREENAQRAHRAIMPQRTTVYRSSRSNTSFSSASPTIPIMARPASITSVFRNSRAPKMSQPRPKPTAVSISTATNTRQARASPRRNPVST